jgi:hypothetical protein
VADVADPWGDDPFCLTPPTPPGPSAPPVELRIDGHWLVEEVQHHTCGAGDVYGHEPGCGLIPVVDLATLPGYAELPELVELRERLQRVERELLQGGQTAEVRARAALAVLRCPRG